MTLDSTDHAIIRLLRIDARQTLAAIGSEVGLSASGVKRRIDRLETEGIIRGYTAIVDHSGIGGALEAFAELTFAGHAPVNSIEDLVSDVPEIQGIFTLAGDPDAVAWIRTNDVDDLKRVIDAIRRTGKVTGTKTLMVLGSVLRAGGSFY